MLKTKVLQMRNELGPVLEIQKLGALLFSKTG